MTTQRRPVPQPRPETQPYWDAAKRGELAMQRCNRCGEFYFYPRPFCPKCHSSDVTWTPMTGRGRLHSYLISHRPMAGYELDVPYVIALVELDEGPKLLTNLVDVEPDPAALALDMALEVVFEPLGELALPQFRPVGDS